MTSDELRRELQASAWHVKTIAAWCEEVLADEERPSLEKLAYISVLNEVLFHYWDDIWNQVCSLMEIETGIVIPSDGDVLKFQEMVQYISLALNQIVRSKCESLGIELKSTDWGNPQWN